MLELAAKAAGEVCGEGQGEQRPGSACWIWLRLSGRKREEKGHDEIPEQFCSQGLHLLHNPEHLSSQCLPTFLDSRIIQSFGEQTHRSLEAMRPQNNVHSQPNKNQAELRVFHFLLFLCHALFYCMHANARAKETKKKKSLVMLLFLRSPSQVLYTLIEKFFLK